MTSWRPVREAIGSGNGENSGKWIAEGRIYPQSDWAALELLEAAAVRARLPLREIDGAIWNAAAGVKKKCS
jgi:hypothetical protein